MLEWTICLLIHGSLYKIACSPFCMLSVHITSSDTNANICKNYVAICLHYMKCRLHDRVKNVGSLCSLQGLRVSTRFSRFTYMVTKCKPFYVGTAYRLRCFSSVGDKQARVSQLRMLVILLRYIYICKIYTRRWLIYTYFIQKHLPLNLTLYWFLSQITWNWTNVCLDDLR